jgi:hypothetical protein
VNEVTGPRRGYVLAVVRGYLDAFTPGEVVTIHWNWACDRLDVAACGQLARATRRAMAHTNRTL